MIINKVPKKIKEFIFIFSFLSIIFMLLHEKNGIHITQTTQISYSVFIIGIFFHKPDGFHFSIALLCF
ncbi:hypothetical protein HmCmsJML285_1542 [Escherichia coli]|nr:hypothetical protein HmCmsJML285_1542 [Escherichia coli]